jgi:hypothetical protein
MRRLSALLTGMLIAAAILAPAAHADTKVHRVAMDAIHHDAKVCPKIEWAVYLSGFDKAERAFVAEWRELGYNSQVSGAGVFEELVAQCARQKEHG